MTPTWNKKWTIKEKEKAKKDMRDWRRKNRKRYNEKNAEHNRKWRAKKKGGVKK